MPRARRSRSRGAWRREDDLNHWAWHTSGRAALSRRKTNLSAAVQIEAVGSGKVPQVYSARGGVTHSSAGAGTQGRAGGERAGAHAEARAEGRGNVAQKVAAAEAVAVAA